MSKVGDGRYTLHRTIHAFAEQKLQRWPELVATRQVQYARYYLEFLTDLERDLAGAAYGTAIEQIQTELDNIHSAWRRALVHQMYPELNGCLTALLIFYDQYGFYRDALTLYEHALSHFGQRGKADHTQLIASLQSYAGFYYYRLGSIQQAETAFEACWALLEEVDDPGVAAACIGLERRGK